MVFYLILQLYYKCLTNNQCFFFFNISGRILNRFTKDMGALDEILPRTLLDVIQIYSTLIFILILNAVALYWTLIPSVILMIIFVFTVKLYLKTAQGIKRLEGTSKHYWLIWNKKHNIDYYRFYINILYFSKKSCFWNGDIFT